MPNFWNLKKLKYMSVKSQLKKDGWSDDAVKFLMAHPQHHRIKNQLFLRPPKARKTYISLTLRKQVFKRDSYRCVLCLTTENLSIDHIYPEVFGGQTVLENLQTLCMPCNRSKGVNI